MKGTAHQPYKAKYKCNLHAGPSLQLDRDEGSVVESAAQVLHGLDLGFSACLLQISRTSHSLTSRAAPADVAQQETTGRESPTEQ